MSFDFPSNNPLVNEEKMVTTPWMDLLNRWQNIISSIQESGTTAQRPTRLLWIGRRYWDTTLQKPIYLSAVKPTVWKDASGGVV